MKKYKLNQHMAKICFRRCFRSHLNDGKDYHTLNINGIQFAVQLENLLSMKMRYLLILCLIISGIFFSCTKESVVKENVEENTPDGKKPAIVYNINVDVMLNLVNEVRAKGCTCGSTTMPAVPALNWNELLSKAAYEHSNDMKTNNYFSHTSGDNTTPGDRIKAVGYNWTTYGENIAMGQTSEQQVMNSWLKSEGHCRNIMNKNFKDIGVGRSGNYWTQVFAAKKLN